MSLAESITGSLRTEFAPTHLLVENESHQHSVKPGSETHFFVCVVSESFEGQNQVARQRRINAALKGAFASGLHALRIRSVTPAEWEVSPENPAAPACMGGSKAEAKLRATQTASDASSRPSQK